jgi:hypothetical protein
VVEIVKFYDRGSRTPGRGLFKACKRQEFGGPSFHEKFFNLLRSGQEIGREDAYLWGDRRGWWVDFFDPLRGKDGAKKSPFAGLDKFQVGWLLSEKF